MVSDMTKDGVNAVQAGICKSREFRVGGEHSVVRIDKFRMSVTMLGDFMPVKLKVRNGTSAKVSLVVDDPFLYGQLNVFVILDSDQFVL